MTNKNPIFSVHGLEHRGTTVHTQINIQFVLIPPCQSSTSNFNFSKYTEITQITINIHYVLYIRNLNPKLSSLESCKYFRLRENVHNCPLK
ncbi:hypothetical protein KSS87_018967 [Heliosperma pusillum]|nr:hypothetical protein KSS87_018967 [Heliosperma pusillum]